MRILVTAGPTREYLDPVRFLSNRSTGRMGFALAQAAQDRGHAVTLIHGPVVLPVPDGVVAVPVVSAADMLEAVLAALPDCDALIMCAAVADWRPAEMATVKRKKDEMSATLALERTVDILGQVRLLRTEQQIIVGFAAETNEVIRYAKEKLVRKGLDLIVANDVSRADAGFEVDTNAVMILDRDGGTDVLPLQSKAAVARHIVERIEQILLGA